MSVRPYGNGRWEIDVSHGRGDRYRFIYPEDPNKTATLAEAVEAEAEFRTGMGLDAQVGKKTKLRHYAADYLAESKDHDADRTYTKKKKILYGYILPYFGEMSPRIIGVSRVNRYTQKRLKEIKSPSAVQGGKEAVNQEIMCLSTFLKFTGYPPKEPFKLFKLIKRVKQIPTKDEIFAIIDAMEPFWRTFYYTMYYTGVRSNEVKSLKHKDINIARRCVFIFGKGSKERIVPINDKLLAILAAYLPENAKPDDLVFPSPKTKEKLVSINKAIFRAQDKLKNTQKITPHLFRHAFGTHMVQAGANLSVLQQLMGHDDIRTTQEYTHIVFGDLYLTEVNKL
jgi:site-specific recombinase XerD